MAVHQTDVDLIDVARKTTIRDIDRVMPGSLKIISPAKVNLYLGVHASSSDGYHPVENVMHALLLHDLVYMTCRPCEPQDTPAELSDSDARVGNLYVHIDMIDTGGFDLAPLAAQDNLIFKAIALLAQLTNRSASETITVRVEKNIPPEAGLAGGSSNAAAALIGAARLWGLPDNDPRIETAAQQIGSDVAFFLKGGCALYDGRGEHFVQSYTPRHDSIVLIKPDAGLSTADVYRAFDSMPTPEKDLLTPATFMTYAKAEDIEPFNGLAAPAETLLPALKDIREWALSQPGVISAQLTGSGSASFVICDSLNTATKIVGGARLNGWWTRSSSFAGTKVAIAPQSR